MEWVSNPDAWSALAALLLLEIVLGVDNVIFISILAAKLPADQQQKARRTGLLAAGGMRVLLLLGVGFLVKLKTDVVTVFGIGFSGKELILLAGGVFLIWKATKEIHDKLEGEEHHASDKGKATFASVIGQVLILDMVFSVDSVITAVGMTPYVPVMVIAVISSVIIMLFASKPIYDFVNKHPTVKMLALAFLLMIGVTLIAEGLGQKIPKGYIYAAIAFSVLVEGLNIRAASKKKERAVPVHLHQKLVPEDRPLVPEEPTERGAAKAAAER